MQWKASFKRKFQGRPSPFVMNIVMCMLMPCPGVSWIIVIVIPSSFSRSFTDSTDGKCRPWHPWHANSHIVIVISYLWLTEMQCWPEKREKIYFFALVTWWLGDLVTWWLGRNHTTHSIHHDVGIPPQSLLHRPVLGFLPFSPFILDKYSRRFPRTK